VKIHVAGKYMNFNPAYLRIFQKSLGALLHTSLQYNWFGLFKGQYLNWIWSRAVIPGCARGEKQRSLCEFNLLFPIDSDTVLYMNLIHWIWFCSCELRSLNWALIKCILLRIQHSCTFTPVLPTGSNILGSASWKNHLFRCSLIFPSGLQGKKSI